MGVRDGDGVFLLGVAIWHLTMPAGVAFGPRLGCMEGDQKWGFILPRDVKIAVIPATVPHLHSNPCKPTGTCRTGCSELSPSFLSTNLPRFLRFFLS